MQRGSQVAGVGVGVNACPGRSMLRKPSRGEALSSRTRPASEVARPMVFWELNALVAVSEPVLKLVSRPVL